jgi:hypothetical protein
MISYNRSYCAEVPPALPPGDRFLCSIRAAERLDISDRYIRTLAKNGELKAFYHPATPKLLFFKLSDILEYQHRNSGVIN